MHAACLRRPSKPSCRMTSPHLQKTTFGSFRPRPRPRPRYPRPNIWCQTRPVFEPPYPCSRALGWPTEMSSSSQIRPHLLRRPLRRPYPCPMDQTSSSTSTPTTWTSISNCKCCHISAVLFLVFLPNRHLIPRRPCYRCEFTSPERACGFHHQHHSELSPRRFTTPSWYRPSGHTSGGPALVSWNEDASQPTLASCCSNRPHPARTFSTAYFSGARAHKQTGPTQRTAEASHVIDAPADRNE